MVWKANNYLEHTQKVRNNKYETWAISMLVTDVGGDMCWRQLSDVGNGFRHFFHQHPLSFNINVGHQQPKDVIIIEILSLTLVTHIYVAFNLNKQHNNKQHKFQFLPRD